MLEKREQQKTEFYERQSREVKAILKERGPLTEESKSQPAYMPEDDVFARVVAKEKSIFASVVTTEKSYASLLDCSELAGFFSRYPHLRGTAALPASRIRTSVTEPKTLDDILGKINEAVENLPQNYAEMMKSTQIKVYISVSEEELSQKCRLKSTGGCYLPKEHTICVSAESGQDAYKETIPHELAHARYEKLPASTKKKLTKAIKPIVYRSEIQKDIVKDKDGYVTSWKDGLTLPRYALVTPRAASNVDEFLAENVEDLYAKKGRNITLILRGEYRQDAVKALEAMKEAGFLGTTEEAYTKEHK